MASVEKISVEGDFAFEVEEWVAMLQKAIEGKSFGDDADGDDGFGDSFEGKFLETSEEVYEEVFSRFSLEERFLLFYFFVYNQEMPAYGAFPTLCKMIRRLGALSEGIRAAREADLQEIYLMYASDSYEWHGSDNTAADNFNWALQELGRPLTAEECADILDKTPNGNYDNSPHDRWDLLVSNLKAIRDQN